MAAVSFAFVRRGGAQKTIERFLKQIVGQRPVAGHAGEIGPQPARRALVECAEGILVHHEVRGLHRRERYRVRFRSRWFRET